MNQVISRNERTRELSIPPVHGLIHSFPITLQRYPTPGGYRSRELDKDPANLEHVPNPVTLTTSIPLYTCRKLVSKPFACVGC